MARAAAICVTRSAGDEPLFGSTQQPLRRSLSNADPHPDTDPDTDPNTHAAAHALAVAVTNADTDSNGDSDSSAGRRSDWHQPLVDL